MNRHIIWIVLLFAVISVHAEISPVSPAASAIIGTEGAFSFSTQSSAIFQHCELILDGVTAKTATYNSLMRGRVISLRTQLEEGPHTWSIRCVTDMGNFSTPERDFTAQMQENAVKVIPSGMFRGSFLHEVTLSDKPVTVKKVSAGDFINIKVGSNGQEFYVKRQSSQDDIEFVLLEDVKSKKEHRLSQGKNISLSISRTPVIITYVSKEQNKVNILFTPTIAPPNNQQPEEPQEAPVETPEEPEQPAETPLESPQEQETPAETPPEQIPQETPTTPPAQGFFKKILSWLSGILG